MALRVPDFFCLMGRIPEKIAGVLRVLHGVFGATVPCLLFVYANHSKLDMATIRYTDNDYIPDCVHVHCHCPGARVHPSLQIPVPCG